MIGEEVKHLAAFKIVGGSLVVHDCANAITDVEQQRLDKWKRTLGRIRHVPRSWKERAVMMRATQAQAFYGQGTHSLCTDVAELRKVRTAVMQSLWKTDFYSFSPLVTFLLLAPVQLDPEFAAVYEGLRSVRRAMRHALVRMPESSWHALRSSKRKYLRARMRLGH